MRVGFFVLSILAAAGVWVSQHLIELHIRTTVLGATDTGLCAQFAGFSCADAVSSVYSTLGSLPIAVLGQAWYVVVLLLAGLVRFGGDKADGVREALWLGAILGVGYSAFLGFVSVTQLGRVCPFCLGLYAVNIGILVMAWLLLPEGAGAVLRGLPRLVMRRATWVAALGMVVAVIVSQSLYARAHATMTAKLAEVRAKLGDKPAHFDVAATDAPGIGSEDAPAVIVEFSDFECPYCKRLSDALHTVIEQEPSRVRLHFRHYPMDNSCNPNIPQKMHEQACAAAVASVCAERQGRFWPMHDLLFANNRRLGRPAFLEFARTIGIDVEAFQACLDDPGALKRVQDDIAQATALEIGGTPTWFVNGWRHMGTRSPDELHGIVRQAGENARRKAAADAGAADSAAP